MIFADTHTHLYLEEFSHDIGEVLERASSAGVRYLILPNIDSTSIESLLHLVSLIQHPASSIQHQVTALPLMGLHPTSVKENYREELKTIEQYLRNPEHKFYGIGEIGIDLYWDKTFEKEQVNVFTCQLELAIGYRLPAVIHTRNSMDLALSIVEELNNPGLRGIFHFFSGNIKQAERAVKAGFKLGIGGVITFRNSGLQQVVQDMRLEDLVLETDAPYLAPVPHRGQRNEPSYIPLIAQKIADLKGVSIEEVAETTTRAAAEMFGIG